MKVLILILLFGQNGDLVQSAVPGITKDVVSCQMGAADYMKKYPVPKDLRSLVLCFDTSELFK